MPFRSRIGEYSDVANHRLCVRHPDQLKIEFEYFFNTMAPLLEWPFALLLEPGMTEKKVENDKWHARVPK
jgi:hypothetical protein